MGGSRLLLMPKFEGYLMNEYQEEAVSTAIFPKQYKLIYPALGLAGETGEVVEKVKKYVRDGALDKEALAKELGDVLWYLANMADNIGYSLSDIAAMNITKLKDRMARNVLQGSGDNR
jgi:NTP pyrophosphatase (non-canonical NTP hydrolase)